MVRDYPKHRRGAPPQTTQAPRIPLGPQAFQVMVTALVSTLPTQPTKGGGRTGRHNLKAGGHAKYYALPSRSKEVASDSIITGIVPICHRDASVLFDLGFTYSYVSTYFAPYLGIPRDSLSSHVSVSMPEGDSIVVDHVYQSCLVVLGGFETRVDLLLLSMVEVDVILGMDWLSPYHTILDYHSKTVTLAMQGLSRLEWRGTLDYVPSKVVSFLKIQHMVGKGCDAYLEYVRDISVDTPTIESIMVVRDYPDVFPADLPGIPPYKDIDFGIDL
ncbi:uncharacterized protein [Nicotiana tomentosiformis]|uniref:uncharacterized protein n=1 Tax=Nicotiana tomentosiformis TaxID=4098 RepID=UPI00388CB5AA